MKDEYIREEYGGDGRRSMLLIAVLFLLLAALAPIATRFVGKQENEKMLSLMLGAEEERGEDIAKGIDAEKIIEGRRLASEPIAERVFCGKAALGYDEKTATLYGPRMGEKFTLRGRDGAQAGWMDEERDGRRTMLVWTAEEYELLTVELGELPVLCYHHGEEMTIDGTRLTGEMTAAGAGKPTRSEADIVPMPEGQMLLSLHQLTKKGRVKPHATSVLGMEESAIWLLRPIDGEADEGEMAVRVYQDDEYLGLYAIKPQPTTEPLT